MHGILWLRMTTKVEISYRTILFIFAFLAAIWFLLQIRDIVYLLFVAFLLMTALRPMVEWLAKYRVPRVVAVLLIYTIVFGFFGISLAGAIPSLVSQSVRLFTDLPNFVSRMVPNWNIDARAFTEQIAPISENVVKVTVGIFSNIVNLMTVLVFSFYFILERRHAEKILTDSFGSEVSNRVISVARDVEIRLGAWVRGQLLLMVIVGVLVYVGLTILHVDYALPLAIIAGILEILPMIGPNLAAVPGILVALTVSPLLAVSVAALYFIIQQIENNIIVPQVMKRSVGFSPLVTILSLMIGARMAGIVGAVLAVPVVITLQAILHDILVKQPIKFGKQKNEDHSSSSS